MPKVALQPLAQVFIRPARNVEFMTTPGRRVKLLGGTAQITDTFDMPVLLGREDMTVEVTPYGMSWIEDWLRAAPRVEAKVLLPDGMRLDYVDRENWKILKSEPEPKWNGKNRPPAST